MWMERSSEATVPLSSSQYGVCICCLHASTVEQQWPTTLVMARTFMPKKSSLTLRQE